MKTMTVADLSNGQPMEPEFFDRGNPARRCTAHRKNGDQCRKWAIQGGNVCATHGGRARQVRAKAQRRLAEAADTSVKRLLGFAFDNGVPDNIALAAVRDSLDRMGISARTALDIEIGPKPFESVLEQVEAGSRSEYRRSRGREDDSEPAIESAPLELEAAQDEPIDVDVEIDEDADEPMDLGFNPFTVSAPSAGPGLMPLDEAVSAQRALPRGS